MRLLFIRLKHFKGVEEVAVEFRPTGITLIQGPNEVGKTSLMKAFDILMEYPDSSRHHEVEATKPAGQDQGTEIEARFEIGSETFTYFKRYHREKVTQLTIDSGRGRRTLAGREAHEYVRNVLDTRMDWELWKALKIVQGIAADQIARVSLGSSASLREALDRVAGGGDGASDDSLFHRVESEWQMYYTPTAGNERRQVFDDSRKRVMGCKQDVERLTLLVAKAENDAERVVHLQSQIQDLTGELGESDKLLKMLANEVAAIQAMESRHRDELENLTHAQDRLSDLERKARECQLLADEEFQLVQNMAELETRRLELQKEDISTGQSLTVARADYEAATAQNETARQTFERLNEDATIFITHTELSALEKQLGRIRQLTRDLATFTKARNSIRVTEDELKAIQKQVKKVNTAAAALEVGSPTAIIRAIRDLTITVNGDSVSLAAEQEHSLSVAERTTVAVPGLMDIAVRPGSSVSEIQAKLDREKETLRGLLKHVGAGSPNDAQDKWNQWNVLTLQMERAQQQIHEELAGTELSVLEQQRDGLQTRVNEYRDRRSDNYVFPKTSSEAEELQEAARETMNEADDRLRDMATVLESAKTLASASKKGLETLASERLDKEGRLTGIRENLGRSRQEIADEDLQVQVLVAKEEVETLKKASQAVAEQLTQRDPEVTRHRENQKRMEVERIKAQISEFRNQQSTLEGSLMGIGGLGLYEQLEEAKASLDKAQNDVAALERRGQAASTLYKVISACRDAEQRRYREPLRQQIVRLGQIVFGHGFDVALDESLKVESRTRHGITLSVEALSTGAKEQLALLVRLGAASLVDPNEGVPIILDDTLGHTDDNRLDLMAAVLNFVAKSCQIILLTSSTKRYTKIGPAHVIDLWSVNTTEKETSASG